jgi:hypothetical protein
MIVTLIADSQPTTTQFLKVLIEGSMTHEGTIIHGNGSLLPFHDGYVVLTCVGGGVEVVGGG